MNGVDVFGAISDPMRGSDLNPSLTAKTLLSDLNGGKGVDKGSLRFTHIVDNRVQTFDIDLSKCVTVGDVQRTIENAKNPHFSVSVDITANGLVFSVANDGYITATTVCELLRKLSVQYAGMPIVIVLDNARYQHCHLVKALALELGITLQFLPCYSPNGCVKL